jgi:hypothetical protein
MSQKNNPQHSKINHLEESLYNKNDAPIRIKTGLLHKESTSFSNDWSAVDQNEDTLELKEEQDRIQNQGNVYKKKMSFLKKFFVSSLLFFFVAVGFGVYAFFIKNKVYPEGNITIGVVGSTFTQAGEELPLTIEIDNKNDFALEVVDLIIEYPREGEKPTASLETTNRSRISLGVIEPRKRVLENIPITLFGKEGDKKEIHFTLEYTIADSSTIFQKQKIYNVTLSSSPIITRIIGAETAVPNQPYHFTLEVSTNTRKPLENIMLALNYPVGFTFESSTIPLTLENTFWDIGTLTPGTPKTIEITGRFAGLNGDERSIRALFGTYLTSDKTKMSTNLGTLLQTVKLEKPFLSTDLFINGQGDEFVNISRGEQIQGSVQWKNNLPNQVLDLEIRVQLKGDLLDRSQIQALDGFYDSLNDTLVWNKNTLDPFVRVPAGESGVLNFTIQTFAPRTDGTIKNPQLEFDVSVRALEDSEGKVPKVVESLERTTVRIAGDVSLKPIVLFRTGPLVNTGTYPPKVNEEVTYTVELNVINTINEHSNGIVQMKLPPNVTFINQFVPNTEIVQYNEKTGEITWNVGNIPRNAGPARTIHFQVKTIPSLSQVGTFFPLLKDVVFTATDTFTKTSSSQSVGVITSEVDISREADARSGKVQ